MRSIIRLAFLCFTYFAVVGFESAVADTNLNGTISILGTGSGTVVLIGTSGSEILACSSGACAMDKGWAIAPGNTPATFTLKFEPANASSLSVSGSVFYLHPTTGMMTTEPLSFGGAPNYAFSLKRGFHTTLMITASINGDPLPTGKTKLEGSLTVKGTGSGVHTLSGMFNDLVVCSSGTCHMAPGWELNKGSASAPFTLSFLPDGKTTVSKFEGYIEYRSGGKVTSEAILLSKDGTFLVKRNYDTKIFISVTTQSNETPAGSDDYRMAVPVSLMNLSDAERSALLAIVSEASKTDKVMKVSMPVALDIVPSLVEDSFRKLAEHVLLSKLNVAHTGFWIKSGLKVKFVPVKNVKEVEQLVHSNRVHFGIVSSGEGYESGNFGVLGYVHHVPQIQNTSGASSQRWMIAAHKDAGLNTTSSGDLTPQAVATLRAQIDHVYKGSPMRGILRYQYDQVPRALVASVGLANHLKLSPTGPIMRMDEHTLFSELAQGPANSKLISETGAGVVSDMGFKTYPHSKQKLFRLGEIPGTGMIVVQHKTGASKVAKNLKEMCTALDDARVAFFQISYTSNPSAASQSQAHYQYLRDACKQWHKKVKGAIYKKMVISNYEDQLSAVSTRNKVDFAVVPEAAYYNYMNIRPSDPLTVVGYFPPPVAYPAIIYARDQYGPEGWFDVHQAASRFEAGGTDAPAYSLAGGVNYWGFTRHPLTQH